MKRIFFALLIVCTSCLQGHKKLDLAYFLNELISPESLCEYPDTEYKTGQASSYDRASLYKGVDGWFANNDGFGIERTDTIAGRVEKVLFEHDSPGVITRIWITTRSPKATLRFYFDGHDEPDWTIPAYDLTQIGIPNLGLLVNPHTSYRKGVSGGSTLFFPIPYAKACKVTLEEPAGWDGVPRYYHINYRSYTKDTEIETFSSSAIERNRRLIAKVNKELGKMPSSYGRRHRTVAMTGASDSLVLDLKASRDGSAINHLTIKADIPDNSRYQDVMGNLAVRIIFDGVGCVETPLSAFSGAGIGAKEAVSRYLRCDGKGRVDVAYLMPYRENAHVAVVNYSDIPVRIELEANVAPYCCGESTMYFRSSFNAGLSIPVSNVSHENYDWNFATVKGGKGVYVADVLSLFNHSRAWYGEGDEKIYVDGECKPSHFGTGTEDYYNSSWAPVIPFHTPFGGASRADLASSAGYNSFFRLRGLDVIPFKTSLVFDLEMISWVKGKVDYFATVFYYGTADCCPVSGITLPLEYSYPDMPADMTKYKIDGCIEFETLECSGKTEYLQMDVQDMLAFPDGLWSAGKQVLGTCGNVGDHVSYVFDGLEKGKYDVTIYATKAGNYARLRFEAGGIHTDFDSFAPVVTNSGKIVLENVDVDGPLTLDVRITGKNEKSAGYFFGLDGIVFTLKQ